MTAAARFLRLARKYGQPVSVRQADNFYAQGYGFLQPITTEQKNYLWRSASKLGACDGAQFRFFGTADLVFPEGDPVLTDGQGQDYTVQELQPMYAKGTELYYWWGILTPRDKEDDCP